MEILKTDFGIKTKEIEEMFTYDDYRDNEIKREGSIFYNQVSLNFNSCLIQIYFFVNSPSNLFLRG